MSEILDVYVGFCQRRGTDSLHWLLMVAPPGSDRCTWYHVTGGPSQGTVYTLQVQANKRLDFFGIATRTKVGSISAGDANKVLGAAKEVPPPRCHRWTTALLEGLEKKGLLPEGTSAQFEAQIEPSQFEQIESSGDSEGSS